MTALDAPETVDAWAEDVIRANTPDLLTYLVRRIEQAADAADVLSNALLVIWDKRRRIPKDPTEARMWSFGVARNALRDYRRYGIRRSALADALRDNLITALPPTSGTDPSQIVEQQDSIQRVRAAIANLKEPDRDLISLIHWDGFTLAQAAQLLGVNASTARTRYARARNRLAVELNNCS